MAKWILVLSVAAVLTRNGMADILVQPGYQAPQHHSIITQPPETMRSSNKNHAQQPKSADYHLEFHPVYTDSYQIPASALYPLLQQYQVVPQLSQIPYNQGDLGLVGMPAAGSPGYVPLAVHNRNRRSSESGAGEPREKRDKLNAVATKSSLDENISPVIDLQSLDGEATENLDEKNVKVRQSDNSQQPITSGTLLGLNPSNMYPMYQQYQIVDPALNSNPEITNIQILPEANAETTQLASEYQEVSSTPIQSPQIKLENLQHAMLLQHSMPQQQQQTEVSGSSEQRNFPDPRPSSATPQSPEADTSDNHSESRAATLGTKFISVNNNKKLLVSNLGGLHHKKVVAGHHQHTTLGTFRHASGGSHPSTQPGHKIHQINDGTLNNFARNSAQQVVQVYQLPNGQTTYLPTTQYTMIPQTYSSNYLGNYGSGSPSPCSSYQICVHNPDDVPLVMYQLS